MVFTALVLKVDLLCFDYNIMPLIASETIRVRIHGEVESSLEPVENFEFTEPSHRKIK